MKKLFRASKYMIIYTVIVLILFSFVYFWSNGNGVSTQVLVVTMVTMVTHIACQVCWLYKKLLSNLKNMLTLRYNVNCIYYYYYNRCICVCSPLWHRGQSLFFLTSWSKSIPHFLQIRRSCTISVCLNLHIIIIIIIVRM